MAKTNLVQSVTRAYELLRLVGQSEEGLTLQQLGQRTGLKLPTVHNLTRTMVVLGMLEKTEQPKRYRLGPSILQLSEQYWHNMVLNRASSVLHQVHEQIDNAIVSFAIFSGGDIIVPLRVTPEMPHVVQRASHLVLSAYTSVSALIYQAYWDKAQLAVYRQRYPFEEFGANPWQSLDNLEQHLKKIREQGYASLEWDNPQGVRLAVPVFTRGHELRGVLGVYIHGTDAHLNNAECQRMVDILREGADLITTHQTSSDQARTGQNRVESDEIALGIGRTDIG